MYDIKMLVDMEICGIKNCRSNWNKKRWKKEVYDLWEHFLFL